MESSDKAIQIVGVEQIATKNMVTVRVRIFLRRTDGKMYTFDADQTVWELEPLWVPGEPLGIVNDGYPK